MEVHERIKNRRLELGLSADDVAEALNVSRATVYRYESAAIEKLPTSILGPLSQVLHCTPAYLMGWDEEPAAKEGFNEALLKRLLAYMKLLNPKGIDELIKRAGELVQLPQYSNKDTGDK